MRCEPQLGVENGAVSSAASRWAAAEKGAHEWSCEGLVNATEAVKLQWVLRNIASAQPKCGSRPRYFYRTKLLSLQAGSTLCSSRVTLKSTETLSPSQTLLASGSKENFTNNRYPQICLSSRSSPRAHLYYYRKSGIGFFTRAAQFCKVTFYRSHSDIRNLLSVPEISHIKVSLFFSPPDWSIHKSRKICKSQ